DAEAAAPLARSGEPEASGAARLSNLVAPHVAEGADVIEPESGVAPPRRRRRIRVARGARQQTDDAEARRVAQRLLARQVRVRVRGVSFDRVAAMLLGRFLLAHRAFFG